jgi:hypothetical protein
VDPNLKKSKTDNVDPKRTYDRNESVEPKLA